MNHKILLGTALAAALSFGANAASACAIAAWSSATGLTVADTGEPTANFSRYSGRCSLRVPSFTAGGRFVQDNTPNNETSYRIRFYYNTGDITGETDIFQARNTGGTNIVRITHDGTVLRFYANTGGAAQSVTVADSRYYSIELAWAAGTVSPVTTGTMTATVTGNSGNVAAAAVAGTVNFTGLANSADSITDARLGLIAAAAAPTVTAPVYFDEFDSRRTTNPGRLCRGDSNGNLSITAADRTAITNELAGTVAAGQPDCNESGVVTATDRTCVTNLLAAIATCN